MSLDAHAKTSQKLFGMRSTTASNVEGLKVNLGAKVKVNSRSGMARLLAKSVGAMAFFQIAPTPVGKSVSC